jgi:hypothetical protein
VRWRALRYCTDETYSFSEKIALVLICLITVDMDWEWDSFPWQSSRCSFIPITSWYCGGRFVLFKLCFFYLAWTFVHLLPKKTKSITEIFYNHFKKKRIKRFVISFLYYQEFQKHRRFKMTERECKEKRKRETDSYFSKKFSTCSKKS